MKRLALLCALILMASTVLAEKKPFTIEALYKIKSVLDPQISPDGKKVAFFVSEYFLEEGKSNSDIYLMNIDGSDLRRLTYHPKADWHPRWSPDGQWLMFMSTRSGSAQVWKLPVNGGEPQQVTDFASGISAPEWFPDGKRILFYSRVFPECGADQDCNEQINKGLEDGPVQAHLADDLLFRHWNLWKDGSVLHTFVYDLASDQYSDVSPGEMEAPAFMTGGATAGIAVSPDGKEVCFSANPDSNLWETTNKDLFIVPAEGGQPQSITDENEAFDAHPAYSPDGRYIAYITQKVPRYESDRFRLALYDRKTGEKKILTEAFDNWVDDFIWAPDSRSIYFMADVKGTTPIYRLDIRSGKIKEIYNFRTVDNFQLTPDGKTLVVARRSIGEPREIWRVDVSGKNARRLTTFNRQIEQEVDIRPAEIVWVDSPTGRKVQTFLVKPHNFDPAKKYPAIINVHGGPQGQWSDGFRGDWQVYPGAGYVLVFPNPHGSSGQGQDYTQAISRDYGGKVYQDVMAVTDWLAEQPYVDADRLGAMGWSYGGYMMMWLEGHTDRFKAIVSMMGLYNLTSFYGTTEELWFPQYDLGGAPWQSEDYQKWSPHNFVKNFKTPCLVITGEKDFRVSYTQSLEFYTALQKMGVPSRLIVFENDGHWPGWVTSMPLYYNAHLEWFQKYLGGDPAPYNSKEMVRNRAFK